MNYSGSQRRYKRGLLERYCCKGHSGTKKQRRRWAKSKLKTRVKKATREYT